RNNKLSIKSKCTAHFQPGLAFLFFKNSAELLGLPLLVNITLHHGNFQIFAVKSQMVVKHFGKDTKYSSLVFIAESLNINIKQNCLRRALGGTVDKHKSSRVVLKFFTE